MYLLQRILAFIFSFPPQERKESRYKSKQIKENKTRKMIGTFSPLKLFKLKVHQRRIRPFQGKIFVRINQEQAGVSFVLRHLTTSTVCVK